MWGLFPSPEPNAVPKDPPSSLVLGPHLSPGFIQLCRWPSTRWNFLRRLWNSENALPLFFSILGESLHSLFCLSEVQHTPQRDICTLPPSTPTPFGIISSVASYSGKYPLCLLTPNERNIWRGWAKYFLIVPDNATHEASSQIVFPPVMKARHLKFHVNSIPIKTTEISWFI